MLDEPDHIAWNVDIAVLGQELHGAVGCHEIDYEAVITHHQTHRWHIVYSKGANLKWLCGFGCLAKANKRREEEKRGKQCVGQSELCS